MHRGWWRDAAARGRRERRRRRRRRVARAGGAAASREPAAPRRRSGVGGGVAADATPPPQVAEDGNTYERDAIVTWLHEKKKMRSPITNAAMGDRLLDSRKARDLVAAAVHSGAVAEADAGAWHVSSARKMATGGLPGGLAGATEHLERAPKSRERELLLRAATLRADMAALVRDGNAADVIGVEAFLAGGFPLEGPKSAPSCDGLPLRTSGRGLNQSGQRRRRGRDADIPWKARRRRGRDADIFHGKRSRGGAAATFRGAAVV